MSLSKEQFVKNSAWTIAELALYPLLLIIATPVFISKLGIEQYGLWMLAVTITQSVNILNIGIGDTIIRLIAQYRAENKTTEIQNVFRYSFSMSLFLFAMAIVVGAIMYVSNLVSWFYKSDNYEFAGRLLFLTTLSWGIKFVEISVLSVFKAFERFDLNSKLSMISKNSVVLGNLLMVGFGQNLLSVLIFTLLISVSNIVLQLIVLHRFNSNIVCWPVPNFFKERAQYIHYNFWYWLQSSIALIGFLTDKLAVAWFTDIKTMGYYYIASMIGANIHNIFLAFGSFIFPRVSYRLASSSKVAPLYYLSRSLIALPGWAFTIGLLLFGDPVFKLWLGNETYLNSILFIKLYLIFEAGMLLIIVPYYFINGTKKIKLNSLFEITIRISHFIAMILGYWLAGVNGIVYGLILSTFINVPFQYYLFHRQVLGETKSLQFLLVMLPVILLPAILIFTNIVFQVSLVIAFIILCKLIYFDSGRKYTNDLFATEKK
ncbi:MAG: hypothetical protein IT236_10535 [Bacteroidia bacterium]|nr:hypothetical protein [Bacteroidia bacterium]